MLQLREELRYIIYDSIISEKLCDLYKACHQESMRQETNEKIAAMC